MDTHDLQSRIYQAILELASDAGINASGKDDVYGCIFGRDTAISTAKIIKACANKTIAKSEQEELLAICKRSLQTLVSLQGTETNIESGEQPGKFIHEYRPDKYERLLTLPKPWYIYPNGELRNYDSIDSTPLALIAIYRYWEYTHDDAFLFSVLSSVEAGLNWIITYGDLDKDSLLEYELPVDRKHGGLVVQSWTDSHESMLNAEGIFPDYPIAPVEVQGYAWLALKLWADFYSDTKRQFTRTKRFASQLRMQADRLKEQFNKLFIYEENGHHFAAQALDGSKRQIRTVTGNPLLLLWASYKKNGKVETILADEFVAEIVNRAMESDMFDPDAGIRTMSSKSPTFMPGQDSYHNGSFWPKLNGMSHEGLQNLGFYKEAALLKDATLKPIAHFGTPVELYIKTETGEYLLFRNADGQESCRQQAWTAATALDLLTL